MPRLRSRSWDPGVCRSRVEVDIYHTGSMSLYSDREAVRESTYQKSELESPRIQVHGTSYPSHQKLCIPKTSARPFIPQSDGFDISGMRGKWTYRNPEAAVDQIFGLVASLWMKFRVDEQSEGRPLLVFVQSNLRLN